MRSRLTSTSVLVWPVCAGAGASAWAVSYPLGTGWAAFMVSALAFVVFALVLTSVARKFVASGDDKLQRAP